MENKTKNIIISIGFIVILLCVFFINILSPDKTISSTERRKLQQFPEISISKILNTDSIKKFESYTADQFIGRDYFRNIKSIFNTYIFRQKDDNNLFEKDGAIYKIDYPLNENNILKSANKINTICNKYFKNPNIYYAIIPDKNYYLENDDHIKIDYSELKNILQNNLSSLNYIDIWNCLDLNDYYKSDLHWKQENLISVVNKIENKLNLQKTYIDSYNKINNGIFYGSYYGQLGIKTETDTLITLSNSTIKNCTTYNFETQKYDKIYTNINSSDKYDIFLSGATPLITIENTKCNSNKELLLFRDSFGSSLAPLLACNYSKITLIDLRYISEKFLEDYIEFNNQDILFLYSTLVLNQGL